MRSTSLLAFTITLTGALPSGTVIAAETDLSARAIMEKEWWAGRIKGMESLSTMTIYNESGQKRVRETASVSKLYDSGRTSKRLIRFLKPADVKGKAKPIPTTSISTGVPSGRLALNVVCRSSDNVSFMGILKPFKVSLPAFAAVLYSDW